MFSVVCDDTRIINHKQKIGPHNRGLKALWRFFFEVS